MRDFTLEGIDHIALTVRDVHASAAWYRDVLGLERRYEAAWGDRPVVVGIGTTSLALFQIDGDATGPDTLPTRVRMRHIAFRADRQNFQRAQAALHQREIPFESQNHTISQSIYFFDPDGYEIEITTYELAG